MARGLWLMCWVLLLLLHMPVDASALTTVMGDAIDPKRAAGVPNADVELYLSDGTHMGGATTDADGKFSFPNTPGGDYYLTAEETNYRSVTAYFTVDGGVTTQQLPLIWLVPSPLVVIGSAGGSVIDVLTGQQLNHVNLEFRHGIDPPDADPVILTTQTSGTSGNYYYDTGDLPAGVYTVEASLSGYRDDTFHIYILGGEHVQPQNGALSPIIYGDEMRIVLTWGYIPADLDSHLWAPDPFGSGKVHLFYDVISTNPWGAYFSLDLDDRDSYGPETTTIHQWEAGTYCFLVHDYTFQFLPMDVFLSYSGAKVTVITATDTYIYYVTPGSVGTGWFVFTVDGTTRAVTPINTYAWDPVPSLVGVQCLGM